MNSQGQLKTLKASAFVDILSFSIYKYLNKLEENQDWLWNLKKKERDAGWGEGGSCEHCLYKTFEI